MNRNSFTEADDGLIRANIGRLSYAAIGRLCSPPRTVDAIRGRASAIGALRSPVHEDHEWSICQANAAFVAAGRVLRKGGSA